MVPFNCQGNVMLISKTYANKYELVCIWVKGIFYPNLLSVSQIEDGCFSQIHVGYDDKKC